MWLVHVIIYVVDAQTVHPCACADGSSMNFEPVPITAEATPLTASSCSGSDKVCNGDILTLLECRYRTIDRYDKEQTLPLVLLEARWLAPAGLLNMRRFRTDRSTMRCV